MLTEVKVSVTSLVNELLAVQSLPCQYTNSLPTGIPLLPSTWSCRHDNANIVACTGPGKSREGPAYLEVTLLLGNSVWTCMISFPVIGGEGASTHGQQGRPS